MNALLQSIANQAAEDLKALIREGNDDTNGGARLRQINALNFMKTKIKPTSGQIFICVKNNKQHSAVKGKFYVYADGELKTYTKRNVTCLLNGDEMLELPGVFERAEVCPFCDMPVYDAVKDAEVTDHDGEACAHEWDAKVKNYCADCGADKVGGKCPKCE